MSILLRYARHPIVPHLAKGGALILLAFLCACAPKRSLETLWVLQDSMAAATPSYWKTHRPAPRRLSLRYVVAGRSRVGDLYLPADGAPQAGMVLVPGIVPLGKDDPRIAAFANTLARARFAVLIPDLDSFKRLQIQPSDVRVVADAFAYLAARADLSPQACVGMVAFSYASGLAMLAGLEPDLRDKARFIVAIGGYHDLARVIRYFSTGYFQDHGRWHYRKPDAYGKWVFVESSLPHLHNPQDRALLEAMVQKKLKDRNADINPLVQGLGPEGLAVYRLLNNKDPDQTPALIATLPAHLRHDLSQLNLASAPLHRLKTHVILVHGKKDNLIPYPESAALAQALTGAKVQTFFIQNLFMHVEFSNSRIMSAAFLHEDLPDFWRMYQAVYALLGERRP